MRKKMLSHVHAEVPVIKGVFTNDGSIPVEEDPTFGEIIRNTPSDAFVVDQFYSNDFMRDPKSGLIRSDISVMVASQTDPELREKIAQSMQIDENVTGYTADDAVEKIINESSVETLENTLSHIEHRISELRTSAARKAEFDEYMKELKSLQNES